MIAPASNPRAAVIGVLLRSLAVLVACGSPLSSQESRPATPANPSSVQDFEAADATREPYQRATDLVSALQVSPGDWAADVGASAGYYSMRLSRIVGSDGRVFAEDITSAAIGWLDARVKAFGLQNVDILKGEADDPKLPSARLSAVLIVDSYHHFSNATVMLEKIRLALKPGGRLVIADYSFSGHRTQTRGEQIKVHEIDPAVVRSEMERAGFEIVNCEDPFVKWRPGVGNTRASATDYWLMTAVRPK